MGNRTMTEELEQLLKNLKLRRILEIYDEQLRAADQDDISYSDFVTRLVRAQWQAKQEGALEWRIQRANLPERWTLEGCGSHAGQILENLIEQAVEGCPKCGRGDAQNGD